MEAHIMVPVNGPGDVEGVASRVQMLVDRGGVGKVTLVRVVPLAPSTAIDFPLDYADVVLADAVRREEAVAFLQGIASRISWGSTDHEVVALQGDEAETLARFAAERRFDSVLMLSRGRSWLGRLFSSNLADRILEAACVPVTVLPDARCVSPVAIGA